MRCLLWLAKRSFRLLLAEAGILDFERPRTTWIECKSIVAKVGRVPASDHFAAVRIR
jgi:hypothetical protein